MGDTYQLHKGSATLSDLKDGKFAINSLVGVDGRIFYVDEDSTGFQTGSDSYGGLEPDDSFATLSKAISACDDWRGDLIICKAATQTVTSAVDFNVKGLTVMSESMGMAPGEKGERFCIYGSHTDGPAATISAPCRIIGMGFCGSEAAGASLEIDGTSGAFDGGNFYHVSGCRFSHWGIAKAYCVLINAGSAGVIEDCMFDGYMTGYTTAAIGLDDVGSNGVLSVVIRNNRFVNVGSGKYCIAAVDSSIHWRFSLVDHNYNVGNAKFINFNESLDSFGSTLICDNYTGGATDTGVYNEAVSNIQGDGFQFSNNHYDT